MNNVRDLWTRNGDFDQRFKISRKSNYNNKKFHYSYTILTWLLYLLNIIMISKMSKL